MNTISSHQIDVKIWQNEQYYQADLEVKLPVDENGDILPNYIDPHCYLSQQRLHETWGWLSDDDTYRSVAKTMQAGTRSELLREVSGYTTGVDETVAKVIDRNLSVFSPDHPRKENHDIVIHGDTHYRVEISYFCTSLTVEAIVMLLLPTEGIGDNVRLSPQFKLPTFAVFEEFLVDRWGGYRIYDDIGYLSRSLELSADTLTELKAEVKRLLAKINKTLIAVLKEVALTELKADVKRLLAKINKTLIAVRKEVDKRHPSLVETRSTEANKPIKPPAEEEEDGDEDEESPLHFLISTRNWRLCSSRDFGVDVFVYLPIDPATGRLRTELISDKQVFMGHELKSNWGAEVRIDREIDPQSSLGHLSGTAGKYQTIADTLFAEDVSELQCKVRGFKTSIRNTLNQVVAKYRANSTTSLPGESIDYFNL